MNNILLYHGTNKDRLEQIKQEGILPFGLKNSFQVLKILSDKIKRLGISIDEDKIWEQLTCLWGERREKVFLTTSEQTAKLYAKSSKRSNEAITDIINSLCAELSRKKLSQKRILEIKEQLYNELNLKESSPVVVVVSLPLSVLPERVLQGLQNKYISLEELEEMNIEVALDKVDTENIIEYKYVE